VNLKLTRFSRARVGLRNASADGKEKKQSKLAVTHRGVRTFFADLGPGLITGRRSWFEMNPFHLIE
jgi:hypothetical protein